MKPEEIKQAEDKLLNKIKFAKKSIRVYNAYIEDLEEELIALKQIKPEVEK